jgi:hypothetical protein
MMVDRSPFSWVNEAALGKLFVIILVFTLSVMVCMQVLGAPLRTEAAPGGIISFEFSGDLETSGAILNSWGEQGKVYAGLQLGLDYLFMPAYALSIALGCVLVSQNYQSLSSGLSRLGKWLAWGQFLAAGLDALENYALIRLLLGSVNDLWPSTAYWSAALKFGLVGIGLLYVVVGAGAMIFSRSRLEASS